MKFEKPPCPLDLAKNVGAFALHIVFGRPDYHDYPISANITYYSTPTTLEGPEDLIA